MQSKMGGHEAEIDPIIGAGIAVVTHRMQLITGGSWHDFAEFHRVMVPKFKAAGYKVNSSSDAQLPSELDSNDCDVLLLFTCLDDHTELTHTDAEIETLARWISSGGRLLALHSSICATIKYPRLQQVIGGTFISHPPVKPFLVHPPSKSLSVVFPMNPFTINDEIYYLQTNSDVEVVLLGIDNEHKNPLAWVRNHGQGRVAYLALGHDIGVWDSGEYDQLIFRLLEWLLHTNL
jgi:type 1 glutamine amidotransferase